MNYSDDKEWNIVYIIGTIVLSIIGWIALCIWKGFDSSVMAAPVIIPLGCFMIVGILVSFYRAVTEDLVGFLKNAGLVIGAVVISVLIGLAIGFTIS